MSKRPLCGAALLWAVMLWLLGQMQVLAFTFQTPKLPLKIPLEKAAVSGEIYKKEEFTLYTNLYIKNANLTINSKQYSIDNVKVHIKREKCSTAFRCGDKVFVKGRLEEIPLPANLGQFNERVYNYARGIKWYQSGESVQVLEKNFNLFLKWQNKIKEMWIKGISKVVPEDKIGFFESVLLGEKRNLDSSQKILFQIMGCSHILAISGLHLSIMGGGLLKILQRLSVPFWAAGSISMIAMILYGGLTGSGAAVMRAAIMFSVWIGALIWKRTYDFLSSAALACILLLIKSPLYLYDSSFLLSFGAILGLGLVQPAFFSKKMQRGKKTLGEKTKKLFMDGIKGGIAVWAVLLPMMMYFFYEISVFGIIINLLVLPTAGILLISGCTGSLLGMCGIISLGKLVTALALLILEAYISVGKIIQHIPFAMWITGKPALWKCVCYYMFLILLLCVKNCKKSSKRRKTFWSGIWIASLLLLCVKLPWEIRDITFLDVGQGDCICIHTGNRSCFLIDGGSSSVSGVGKYRILPFLKACGIQEIKGIFVSHTDLDHISGIQEILESVPRKETQIKLERLFLSECEEKKEKLEELEKKGKKAGCKAVYIKKGTKIREGKVQLECLAPDRKDLECNEGSQAFCMTKGSLKVLFTGDIEGEGENELFQEIKARGEEYDVLKVAHHGSKNSTKEEFLEIVNPKASVISCGKDNSYGHPHKELLERLENYTEKMLFTMEEGEIRLTERKNSFCIESRLGKKRYLFMENEP
ncbi:MAG: DNA internalization-related competence protein ComEC/Rec2 [Blautia sp.]|nr:DNA internalization-related competence protein ComEC/Rec2 [Blautia sp.]